MSKQEQTSERLTLADVRDELARAFPDDEIKWKASITTSKGKPIMRNGQEVHGMLPYVDARAIMERLDDAVGPDNWSVSYAPSVVGTGVECRLTVCGVTKADVGTTSDIEPEKGAYSDALKRAAVLFGIGRHLYEMELQWVPAGSKRPQTSTDGARTRKARAVSKGQRVPARAATGPDNVDAFDESDEQPNDTPDDYLIAASSAPDLGRFAQDVARAELGYEHARHVVNALRKLHDEQEVRLFYSPDKAPAFLLMLAEHKQAGERVLEVLGEVS